MIQQACPLLVPLAEEGWIDNEVAKQTLSYYLEAFKGKEIDETDYLETIYKITENRNAVISEANIYKRKQKLIGFLMRKGFENELIYRVVNEVVS